MRKSSVRGSTPTPTFASLRVVFRDTKRYLRAKIFTLGIFRKSAPQQKTTRTLVCGFTLIELLVVIAIIALLASIILASLNTARSKSRDARRIADVKQIQLALELYYNDHGGYPNALSLLPTGNYISAVPTDPLSGLSYAYAGYNVSAAATCTSYHLGAKLENNTTGPGSPLNGDADYNDVASTQCTGGAWAPGNTDIAALNGGFSGVDPVYDVRP